MVNSGKNRVLFVLFHELSFRRGPFAGSIKTKNAEMKEKKEKRMPIACAPPIRGWGLLLFYVQYDISSISRFEFKSQNWEIRVLLSMPLHVQMP